MQFDEIRESIDGITRTAVVRHDCRTIEIRHVTDRGSKEILCVPSQYGCTMNCGFCGAPDLGMADNIPWGELEPAISLYIATYLSRTSRPILVSFMGSGEPLMNWKNVLDTASRLNFPKLSLRFAMATMLPAAREFEFFRVAEAIDARNIDMKVHLSLHFTDDETRGRWMPGATRIYASLATLEWYHEFVENQVEVHYMLIDGVNTFARDRLCLVQLLRGRNLPLKLLRFNPRPDSLHLPASRELAEDWARYFNEHDIKAEYYETDGVDISAACGMFDRALYRREAA